MSEFIRKKKSKVTLKFTVDELDEKDTTFTLKNINPGKLDKEYNMKDVKNNMETTLIDSSFIDRKKKTQKKSDLSKITTELEQIGISDNKLKTYETIVSSNMKLKAYVCFKEEHEKKEIPSVTHINCWWCRHSIPITIHPLGMPIRYNKSNEYFDTEGMFCSFNCMCSYLHDNVNVSQYKDSGALIYLMYKQIFNVYPHNMNIKKAPSWKLLKEYGGNLSIEEFRCMFNIVTNLKENIKYNTDKPTNGNMNPVKLVYLD